MRSEKIIGIDIAGATNTWVCEGEIGNGKLVIPEWPTKNLKLYQILEKCLNPDVAVVAIDAPLTWQIQPDSGMRNTDEWLRARMNEDGGMRRWIQSQNSLMAVPLRAKELVQMIRKDGGQDKLIIETHPTVSLFRSLGANSKILAQLQLYKKSATIKNGLQQSDIEKSKEDLYSSWMNSYPIVFAGTKGELHDGAIDSIVCATVAFLRQQDQGCLTNVTAVSKEKPDSGREIFWITNNEHDD